MGAYDIKHDCLQLFECGFYLFLKKVGTSRELLLSDKDFFKTFMRDVMTVDVSSGEVMF